MASPHAPRTYLVDRTVAPDGQPQVWEGGLRAHEWSFSGYADTQPHIDALVAFTRLGRRFHLRDHRNRVLTVTFTALDMRPVRNIGRPLAQRYAVQALVYSMTDAV